MEYAEIIADIKRRAGRIKTLLDKADPEKRFAPQAISNASGQLTHIQQELVNLENALQQFAGEPRAAVKVGPSETK